MTNEQCRSIAEAAIAARDARADLEATEARSADHQSARDQRRASAAASTALDRAIRSAVEK
jgi:hypothetical protein